MQLMRVLLCVTVSLATDVDPSRRCNNIFVEFALLPSPSNPLPTCFAVGVPTPVWLIASSSWPTPFAVSRFLFCK